MKTIVCCFVLFFAIVAAETDEECPVARALKSSIDECVDDLKPSEETLKLIAEQKGEDSAEVRCFMACMMNKSGLMEKAKFQFDKLEELFRSEEKPDEKKINEVLEMMKSCKEESEVSEDECVVAGNYFKCSKAKQPTK